MKVSCVTQMGVQFVINIKTSRSQHKTKHAVVLGEFICIPCKIHASIANSTHNGINARVGIAGSPMALQHIASSF